MFSRKVYQVHLADGALEQLRAETFYRRKNFGRGNARLEKAAQLAEGNLLKLKLLQLVGLFGVHAREAHDGGLLCPFLLAFPRFLDGSIEGGGKLGEAGREHVVGAGAPSDR